MVCGGSGKRLPPCRFRGNGRQGCHFHNDLRGSVADGDTGFCEQGFLVEPEARGPRGGGREKDKPSVAYVREATFAGQRGGQEVAKSSVERIQGARAHSERVEGGALRNRHEAGMRTRRTAGLHGGNHSAVGNEHHSSREIPFDPALP